jgi:hypothetical protein
MRLPRFSAGRVTADVPLLPVGITTDDKEIRA